MCSEEETFTFTWLIENFNLCTQENGECITSSTFRIERFLDTKWSLALYPRGKEQNFENYISCCLCRIGDDDVDEIVVELELFVNSISKGTQHIFTKDSECELRFSNESIWNERKELTESVVVKCHMITPVSDMEDEALKILPTCLESLPCELREEISLTTEEAIQSLQKELWPYPRQCNARTRVSREKRAVSCSIRKIVCLRKDEKLHVLVPSVSEIPNLLIIFSKILTDKEENLCVKLCFTDKLLKNTSLYYQCEIVSPLGESSNKSCGSHLFLSNKSHEMSIVDIAFKYSKLKKYMVTHLKFEFVISDGTLFSNIDCTERINYFTNNVFEKSFENSISQDMFRYYTEKKFCDVILKTTEGNLQAHKIILCSMSPVFSAMLEGDMKENDTIEILIEDLDYETCKQMLVFMYTGKFEDLKYSGAMKLFTAANIYQIELLKKACRKFLLKDLSIENVCSVLLLENGHKDKELKEYATYFLSIHKNEIFLKQEWKILSDSHAKLGLEILQEVCTQKFEEKKGSCVVDILKEDTGFVIGGIFDAGLINIKTDEYPEAIVKYCSLEDDERDDVFTEGGRLVVEEFTRICTNPMTANTCERWNRMTTCAMDLFDQMHFEGFC